MPHPDRGPPSESVHTVITGIYAAAEISSFPGNGAPTAIFKTPVHSRVQIGREGIVGDHQADRRVHGGPEKAVHHYAAINYSKLSARFPETAAALCPAASERIFRHWVSTRAVSLSATFSLSVRRSFKCASRAAPAGRSTRVTASPVSPNIFPTAVSRDGTTACSKRAKLMSAMS